MNFNANRPASWPATPLIAVVAFFLIMATATAAQPDEEGWIPFDADQGLVAIDAAVNGEHARLILDSGAGGNVMSADLAERADIAYHEHGQVRVTGVHGQAVSRRSRAFDVELAGQTIPLRDVIITPGTGFDLLIGRGLFDQVVVQIDYPERRIRLLSPDAVEFESNVNTRRGRNGELLVETRINGNRARLILDTGNSSIGVLTRRFVRRNRLEEFEVEQARIPTQGVVAQGEMQLLQLDQFEIGPYAFEGFLAAYQSDGNEGIDSRTTFTGSHIRYENLQGDGLLGYEILRNFVVTMDTRRGKLHLGLP